MNEKLLEVRNITKKYDDKTALKDVSFHMERGEIVGLLGENGAGKTTLLKSIVNLLNIQKGEVYFQGESMKSLDDKILNSIGVLIDPSFYNYLTTYNNMKVLLMISKEFDNEIIKNKIDNLLKFVGLENNIYDKVTTFSFGMKQRLGLAQTLINKPRLLILDEPFVGLDPLGREIVKNKLIYLAKEQNVGIIFSSHQLSDIEEICDRIIMIHKGQVKLDDSYSSIINDKTYYFYTNNFERVIKNDELLSFKGVKIDKRKKRLEYKEIYSSSLSELINKMVNLHIDITSIDVKYSKLQKIFNNI